MYLDSFGQRIYKFFQFRIAACLRRECLHLADHRESVGLGYDRVGSGMLMCRCQRRLHNPLLAALLFLNAALYGIHESFADGYSFLRQPGHDFLGVTVGPLRQPT